MMNKTEFINKLTNRLSYSKEQCLIINEILENNFFISKGNKNKIVAEFMSELNIEEAEANKVYDISTKIIKEEVKNKLKHPFKSRD